MAAHVKDQISPSSDQGAFSISGLNFSIGGRKLLTEIAIDFYPGEFAALIGHNGSGKSTLLKILARQMRADTGSIQFAGKPHATFGDRAFSRNVAYLPQDVSLAHGMTVRELVACGRYPWHGALGRFSAADGEKVDEAISLTHIEDLANRQVETLSGGERQRAWIAMLMAQDSRCLLLDEPTSALDIAHQIEVLDLIRRLSDARGLSVIVVMHDVNMAARYCDRIHALKGGRLVASGTPDDIMNRETLETIYGIRMDVTRHPSLDLPVAYVC